MKRNVLWLTALFCLLAANITYANETDGYIVKLKPTATFTVNDDYELDQMTFSPQYCRVESMEELETYIGMENVESIEPRRPLTLLDLPDDPYYDEQWGYTKMKAEYARLVGVDGDGIRVAVIDTGLNQNHEDFDGADIHDGENFARVSKDDNTVNSEDVTDYIGHGTAVSSVILSQPDNGKGRCGVAPGVMLVPMRIFSLTESYDDWAAEAIYAAVDKYDCDVINMSFGLMNPSSVLTDAVEYACEQGVILVASAGNDGDEDYYYPASFDGVISVASVDADEECSYFSQHNDKVFITAPGSDIILTSAKDTGGYFTDSGTSFSAPAVAALAALTLQADSGMTAESFRVLLKETSVDLGKEGYDVYFGNGMIDIEQAMKALGVTLDDVTAKKCGSDTKISGFIEGYAAGEETQIALAGYDGTGKMIAFAFPELTADKIGVVDVQEIFEQGYDSFATIRLFWVKEDEQMCPTDTPKQIEMQ